MADLPFVDITVPGFDLASGEVTAVMEGNWCMRTPLGLAVLGYAEMQDLMRDPRLVQDGRAYLELVGITSGPVHDWFVPLILHQHGQDHARLRRLVNRAFTPAVVNGLLPFIRETTASLTGELASAELQDFIEVFADPLPVRVMSGLLGIPAEDYGAFHRWSTDIGLVYALVQYPEYLPRLEAAVRGLFAYVDGLVRTRERDPGDDLVSHLIRAQDHETPIGPEELRNLVVSIIFAAHDTTSHQLGQSMVAFAAHPGQWRTLREHPELAPQAVEELLRWCPAVTAAYRSARQDVDYKGMHIPAGSFVAMCVKSAHRDRRTFHAPEVFDITVPRRAAPLVFGTGPHFCLGAATARTELREALVALTSRLGPPSVSGEPPWRGGLGICGPESLHLHFAS
ncbi:cytochrome P450 [Streptomyces sp. ET3-23]|uniref:cytochrome P450 n=1 Tax=Streptomyces sp. ET3-23 TaxID=2885643 RepID=UPI001D123979|nr:cytochrome P450 [Streptomyces sp. ET3-23]MCC2280664.1 cytochrome P450 [Streptomyces sp. ET3-23]